MSICHSPPLSDQNTYKHVVWTFLRQDQICTFYSWTRRRRRPKCSTTDLIGPPPLKHSKNFEKVMDEFKLPFSITPSTNSFICALRFFTPCFCTQNGKRFYVRMQACTLLGKSIQECSVVKPWKFYWISNLNSDYNKIKHNLFFQTLPWWGNRVWSVKNSEGVIDNNRCLSLHFLCPILCCTISQTKK